MAALESWIEKLFQGSSTEKPLERISVTMGTREAGKAASEFANTASKSFMDNIPTHCLCHGMHTAQHIHTYGTREVDIPTQQKSHYGQTHTLALQPSSHTLGASLRALGTSWLLPRRRPPAGS